MLNAKPTESLAGLSVKLHELRQENERLREELKEAKRHQAYKQPRRPDRRTWTVDEIREIRRLRDEEGMMYAAIGERMGMGTDAADKIRAIYHTGRRLDRKEPTVARLCWEHGMTVHMFASIRKVLKDQGKPSSNLDVVAAYKGET